MVVHHPFALRECAGLCQIEYSAARSHATVTAISHPTLSVYVAGRSHVAKSGVTARALKVTHSNVGPRSANATAAAFAMYVSSNGNPISATACRPLSNGFPYAPPYAV